jgi:hypothetical protein
VRPRAWHQAEVDEEGDAEPHEPGVVIDLVDDAGEEA